MEKLAGSFYSYLLNLFNKAAEELWASGGFKTFETLENFQNYLHDFVLSSELKYDRKGKDWKVKHKNITMCVKPDCKVHSNFGFAGDMQRRYCRKHSLPFKTMINVRKRLCKICHKTQARYGIPGKGPQYCGKCGKTIPGVINLTSKMCKICGKIQATRGDPADGVAKYCKKCGDRIGDWIVDVTAKKCEVCHKTQAFYGDPLDLIPRFCAKDKQLGMVDVRSRRCVKCGLRRAMYKTSEFGKYEYCPQCKEDWMISSTKKCEKCGLVSASYGDPMDGIAHYCFNCKDPGMVNVKNNLCIICNKTRALFGKPGRKPEYCGKCHIKGTIPHPRKRCKECFNFATVGKFHLEYCWEHVPDLPEYKNLIEECNICGAILDLNDEGKCSFCSGVAKRLNRKEIEIREHLEAAGFRYDSCDLPVSECGDRERPDFLFLGEHADIILEVDEYQHSRKSYQSCEVPRMVNIQQSLGHVGRPCIFIRYNPDPFHIESQRIDFSLAKRYKILDHLLRETLMSNPDEYLSVYHLFYDGFDESNILPGIINVDEYFRD